MEFAFEKTTMTCLDPVLEEVRGCEQSQQIRLPDDAPDVGQILGAWGQAVLRGKEWHDDAVSVSGGVMAWVLYAPEDGGPERCVDVYLPFQLSWDLPDGTPEGCLQVQCLTRFVDARAASARKLVVRAGVSVQASAWAPRELERTDAVREPEGVELLRTAYPVRLPMEAGEKAFTLDEELPLPDGAVDLERLIYYRLDPQVTDCKVLSGRVVFRGACHVHVLCRTREERLQSLDLEVPFSQYTDLDGEYGADAQAQFRLCPTSAELEPDEEGRLRLRCGVAAQYLITDRQLLELVEDAYSPTRQLEQRTGTLELPAQLEKRREELTGQQTLPGRTGRVLDTAFWPDFPRQRRSEDALELEAPGTIQVLGRGEDGRLWGGSARWEGCRSLKAHERAQFSAQPLLPQVQAEADPDGLTLKATLPLELTVTARQELPMLTGVEVGDPRPADPERPSLILRRAGEDRLWDIAKASGSTVAAIRRANQLTEDPAPTQMLLIPVLP